MRYCVHSEEKAQRDLQLMQEAILETVTHNNQQGIRNSDIARALGLESDFEGKQHNYLSWSAIRSISQSRAAPV